MNSCYPIRSVVPKRSIPVVLGFLSFLLTLAPVFARPFRPARLPNGTVASCANCHVSPSGGGTRTPFGAAVFAIVGGGSDIPFWSPTLAALDSDGDGYSNGVELGDPDGDFLNLGPASQVSNPGRSASIPIFPPVLQPVPPQNAVVGTLLSFPVSASDDNLGQTLTFSLGAGSPLGAAIAPSGATNALFTWTPTADQAPSTNLIAVIVTDDGVPPRSATNIVTIVVTSPQVPAPAPFNPAVNAGQFSVTVATVAGATYHLEAKATLAEGPWSTVAQVVGDGTSHVLTDPNLTGSQGFYRVRAQ